MKTNLYVFSLPLLLLAGCSSPSDQTQGSATDSVATSVQSGPSTTATATQASATGLVTAVDPSAKTVTIQHGPVAALDWPAMTMTFHAPDADLGATKVGDHVTFDFTSSGMDATITSLTRD